MIKTLEQWIEVYCKKTNDVFNVPIGYQLAYHPTRGFCVYALQDNVAVIYEVGGDGLYWKHHIETNYIFNGKANVLGSIFTRPIKPYLRLMGFEFVDGDIEGRFLAKDKELGCPILCTVRGENRNGNKEYVVTEYFNRQCPDTLKEFLEREDTDNVETQE